MPQLASNKPTTPPAKDKKQTLGQQLAGNAPATRAERHANRHLLLSRGRAGKEEIGDVCTRNQQHQTRPRPALPVTPCDSRA
jgi:hypothetical protein